MSAPVGIMRTFSVENARLACDLLRARGIEARFEDPDYAANPFLGWSGPVTEYVVEVDETRAEKARGILEAEMPEDEGPAEAPIGLGGRDVPVDTAAAKSVAVMLCCWLAILAILTPVVIWAILTHSAWWPW